MAPAITTFTIEGQTSASLVLAWVDQTKNQIALLSSSDGVLNPATVPNYLTTTSQTAPALVEYNGALVMVWTDSSQHMHVSSSPSGMFQNEVTTVSLNYQTTQAPGVAVFNNALCLAWTSGGQIQFWSSPDGSFSSGQPTAVAGSAQAPALGVLNNELYLALIHVMSFGSSMNVPLIELKFSFDGQNFFPVDQS